MDIGRRLLVANARDARLYNLLNFYNLHREATRSTKNDWHEIAYRTKTAAAIGDFGKLS